MANKIVRSYSIEDTLWEQARDKAKKNGATLSGVIRELLTAYVKNLVDLNLLGDR